jgi:HEAT repeat protein
LPNSVVGARAPPSRQPCNIKYAASAAIAEVRRIRDEIERVRESLEDKNASRQAAISAFVDQLGWEEPIFRRLSAENLGEMGADAKSAIPALTKALEDDDAGVRKSAADALDKIRHGKN